MTDYLFLANNLALDFVNTEVILAGSRTDLLQNFASLTAWCEKAGLGAGNQMMRLAAAWGHTEEGAKALQSGRELRSVLRKNAENVAKTGSVSTALAAVLNRRLQNPRLRTKVHCLQGRLMSLSHWVLEEPCDLLVPIAQSAADFFATADYAAIRKCEDPDCILVFHDISKNRSRRWCSITLCGNRAKVSAFRGRL